MLKLAALASEARALGRADFVTKYPEPFLVRDTGGASLASPAALIRTMPAVPVRKTDSKRASKFETKISGGETQRLPADAQAAAKALYALASDPERALAWPLKKSDRNPFGTMITIGRTKNNDIIIEEALVSKFHASVVKQPDGSYQICDQGSTNATTVDGRRLSQGETEKLTEGSQITLAPGVTLKLMTAGALHTLLTGS